jgi:hypothetical protein
VCQEVVAEEPAPAEAEKDVAALASEVGRTGHAGAGV